MPANHRHPAPHSPASPTPKITAKYTSRDGSKFITVPKGPPSTDPSQPSTPTSSAKVPIMQSPTESGSNFAAPVVNRKKQKRRAKAAAKAAAEQPDDLSNDHAGAEPGAPAFQSPTSRYEPELDVSDDEGDYRHRHTDHAGTNGFESLKSKKAKKKKKKTIITPTLEDAQFDHIPEASSQAALEARGPGISKEKIWNTSSQEERERIKEFWLGLGEDERKSLVKVEKDAVLKKMKEQQKHTCSCTVCGRKRTAIEEELEGLYDAYYEELEQFANQGEGPPMLGPPRDFGLRRSPLPSGYSGQPPSRARIVEELGDDEEDPEEGYSEEDPEEEEYSDDEPPEDSHSHDRDMADFLTFGNSLQVKGGILTVADDLLKNDGKRFIEMMEQLAERRMAREEDAKDHFARNYYPNGTHPNSHNHPPPEDDYDDEDDEEDDDYDDSQEEDYEDEEVSSSAPAHDHKHSSTEHFCCHHQDTMTEEQRMEEGRRMFQIFAARMFEQRVLTAYREMVAKQRQQQLIEELEEETRQDSQRKAKKAKDAQKRKDKAAQKKQAQAEEKARREAEKAAEEAARLEEEQKRADEQKQRAEEKRRKKEAQKKVEEDERLRRESERQKKLHEQQEKKAEQERKVREAKEKEKRLKDEQRLREKEARDQKEKEIRDRKDKQDREKREREQKSKADGEVKADREGKDRQKQEERAALKVAALTAAPIPTQPTRRPSQHPVSIPTVLPQHPPNPASFASPKIPVATPAIPKAPTPARPRNIPQSQDTSGPGSQASQSGSAPSQNPSPHSSTPVHTSPAPIGQQRKASGSVPNAAPQQARSISPSNLSSKGLVAHAPPFNMPPMGMPHPPGFPQMQPPGLNRMPDPMFGPMGGFRPAPGMMPMPPGLNGLGGRGFPLPHPPPGFPQPPGDQMPNMGQGFPIPKESMPPSHSRQLSGSFESGASGIPSQPIGRPAPIGRPGSVVHGQGPDQLDDFPNQHLGSSALLDDSEEPIDAAMNAARHRTQAPGPRPPFQPTPFGMDAGFHMPHNPWGPTHVPFGPPPGLGNPTWGNGAFVPPMPSLAQIRSAGNPRSVAVRLMLCRACKELQGSGSAGPDGFIELSALEIEVDNLNRVEGVSRDAISEIELLDLAETEGNLHNGGGSFDIRLDAIGPGKHSIRWAPDPSGDLPHFRPVGAPGEIGSPIIGSGSLAFPSRGL